MADVRGLHTEKLRRLVEKIARDIHRKYAEVPLNCPLELSDLIQAGYQGLATAASQYSSQKNVPYLAYAALNIRWAIQEHVRCAPAIKMPPARAKALRQVRRAADALEKRGEAATVQALADHLGWRTADVDRALKEGNTVRSIDPGQPDGTDGTFSYEHLPVFQDKKTPEQHLMQGTTWHILHQCLSQLPDPKYRIVLIGNLLENKTLEALGELFNRGKSTIGNWITEAKSLMKTCMEAKGVTRDDLSVLRPTGHPEAI